MNPLFLILIFIFSI